MSKSSPGGQSTETSRLLFEGAGQWWLPGNETEKREGRLECLVGQGVRLLLDGSFGDMEQRHTWPVIVFGELDGGTKVTLSRCWRQDILELNAGSSIPRDARFAAEAAYVGQHFDSVDSIRFSELEVCCTGLLEWLGIGAMSLTASNGSRIHNTWVPELQVQTSDGRVAIKADFTRDEDPRAFMSREKLVFISFGWNEALPLGRWRSGPVALMQDFLTLAMRADTPPVALRANAPASSGPKNVDIYVHGMGHPKDDIFSQKPRVLLMHLLMIDQTVPVLTEWFAKAALLEPSRVLLCELLRHSQLPVRLKFLLVMQALEAYHRSTRNGRYLPDREFEALRVELSQALAKHSMCADLKASLLQRLKYGNEYSLRRRLRELAKSNAESLGELRLPVDEMVEARNRLTHLELPGSLSQVKREELAMMTRFALALTEACLLGEVGLPQATIREMVGQDQYYVSAQEKWARRQT